MKLVSLPSPSLVFITPRLRMNCSSPRQKERLLLPSAKYLKALSDGSLDNSYAEKFRDLVSDNVSWDWSDGTKASFYYRKVHASSNGFF
ncbi:hypothetical protein ACHAWO_005307 [Cyclotella atomus]|uniref:Uncharacterized protein n=1 Tax=Cyclotella atomus TaxID=382360 RepID=A0ABD3PE31_9STRA